MDSVEKSMCFKPRLTANGMTLCLEGLSVLKYALDWLILGLLKFSCSFQNLGTPSIPSTSSKLLSSKAGTH